MRTASPSTHRVIPEALEGVSLALNLDVSLRFLSPSALESCVPQNGAGQHSAIAKEVPLPRKAFHADSRAHRWGAGLAYIGTRQKSFPIKFIIQPISGVIDDICLDPIKGCLVTDNVVVKSHLPAMS